MYTCRVRICDVPSGQENRVSQQISTQGKTRKGLVLMPLRTINLYTGALDVGGRRHKLRECKSPYGRVGNSTPAKKPILIPVGREDRLCASARHGKRERLNSKHHVSKHICGSSNIQVLQYVSQSSQLLHTKPIGHLLKHLHGSTKIK